MSKIECNCKKCLKLEDRNGIENLKRCEFCGHYFINWADGSGCCDCKEGQKIKSLMKTHFDQIIGGQLEFHDLSKQGKDKILREICKRIKKLEEKEKKK